MSSKGESKIPGATGIPKRKSFLPAPKSYSKPPPSALPCLPSSDTVETPPLPPESTGSCPSDVSTQFIVGDRVKISGVKTGVIRFIGKTQFAEGIWCGVELDEPDGKHDGMVGETRYFNCTSNHGIFAPIQKVEIHTEDLYMDDSPAIFSDGSLGDEKVLSPINSASFIRERSTPPEGTSRLPQPKSHNRSKSLDAADIEGSPEQKTQSKLARPKAIGRSLSNHGNKDTDSLTDSTPSSRESSVGRGSRSKPSKLSPPGRGPPRKAEKRAAKDVTRDSLDEGEQMEPRSETHVQGKKTKISHQKQQLDTTYVQENTEDEDDISSIDHSSMVDAHTALTLAYNVESSGSDSDMGKQSNTTFEMKPQRKLNSTFQAADVCMLNSTFNKDPDKSTEVPLVETLAIRILDRPLNATFEKTLDEDAEENRTFQVQDTEAQINATFNKHEAASEVLSDQDQLSKPGSGAASSLHSPIPDLLTSAGFVRQASLEWEPETDVMGISMASSLGILSDTQLMENSFLGEDFKQLLRKKEQQVREQELLDAELDKEIAGIATPEIDMSSSTLSGKESSPEPELCKVATVKNLTFDHLQMQTSTPLSPPPPNLKSAGEKLASPMTDSAATKSIAGKLYYKQLQNVNATFCGEQDACVSEGMDTDTISLDMDQENHTYEVQESGDFQSDTYTKKMQTSTNLDELKCHRLSASFELAKTAVEQYASLVKGAEEEKAHQDHGRVKFEDARVTGLKKTNLLIASCEGRLDKLVNENDEGLMEVPFPADLMSSFTHSVSVDRQFSDDSPVESDVTLLYPFKSVESFWESSALADKQGTLAEDEGPDVPPNIMLSSLEEYQNMEQNMNKTCDLVSEVSLQELDPDPKALDSTYGAAELTAEKIHEHTSNSDMTMSTDSAGRSPVPPNLCSTQEPRASMKPTKEQLDDNKTVQTDLASLSVKNDNIENDPDSLNVLMERCISLDSLEGQDSLEKDTTPTEILNIKKQLDRTTTGDLDVDVHNNMTIMISGSEQTLEEAGATQCITEDQLMADLEAGHVKNERPVSLVSSCSADTGIMADYKPEGDRQTGRPVSIMSTTSVDTGYQPDQETDLVSLTTSSSAQECDTITQTASGDYSYVLESDRTLELDRGDPSQAPDDLRAVDSTVTNGEGAGSEEGGMSRVTAGSDDDGASRDNADGHKAKPEVDWVESDMDQRSQLESDPGESDPEETSGTESQQGEDTTVQEACTPETDTNMDDDDLPLESPDQQDHVEQDSGMTNLPAPGNDAVQESMDMEQNLVTMTSTSDHEEQAMDTEMVESATMKDTMEKCQKSEPEQLVAELCVQAHFVQRDVDMEVSHDRKIENSEVSGTVFESSAKTTLDMSLGTYDTNKTADSDLCGVEKLQDTDEHVVARDIVIESGEEASLDTSNSGQDDNSAVAKSGHTKKSTKTLKTVKDSQKVARVQRKRKDLESPGLPNSKNPRAPQSPEPKSDSKKSSPKLVAKSATMSQKSPPPGNPQPVKSNAGSAKKSASKNIKNVSNKKKFDVSSSSSVSPQSSHKGTPEKKFSAKKVDPTKAKDQEIVKARKQLDLLQSVSSISVAPHLTTIEARPVILSSEHDSGSEDAASQRSVPATRRSLPTTKWRSAENKTTKDISSKDTGPSKLSHPQTGTTQGKPKTGIPKGIPKPQSRLGGVPRPSTGNAKRPMANSATTAKVSTTATEPKVAKTSLKPPTSRLAGRKSVPGASTTDGAPIGTTDKPQMSRPSSAPGSRLSKPRTSSSTLQKTDRSMSMGSDTPGHKSQSENISGTSSAPVTPRKPNLGPRRSLAEPGSKRPEPGRRATLALPSASRLTGPKGTSKGLAPIATSTPAPKRNSNQNKNKPVRNGSATSQPSGTIQRPNQPDLVTNACISNSAASQEVDRLEALCEARTKELSKIKMQLRKRSTGFEAMAVLIKYLTEELNAFSCPRVAAQLSDAQEHLQRAAVHLEELTNQRDALIAEIQCIKQQNADDTGKLVSSHQVALHTLEQRLTTERDDHVKKLIAKHSQDLAALKSFHERNIREFETERNNLLAEKEAECAEELTRRKQEFDQDSADLHQEHESKLTEITMRFESIKINLLEKVEFLRTEGEDLRRREASMLEKCQRDSEYKIQHGLAQYKQEVDSLRTVMELRNAEIHELRRRNIDNEKRLEEIPKSRDEIKSLKQKVENLQAIIDIRADNEKQLSEKHQVLLRKYDRETKAMKRVSMDNEELVWRLSMSDMSSPDSFRRSVSHSPTNSECSTPEPTRRRKSPMPHSPRSPVDPKTSPLQKTPPVTNLKRSGTYDLLNQDFDEESNNIRPDS